jgi:nucleotide-binding universal stress UspA family protein
MQFEKVLVLVTGQKSDATAVDQAASLVRDSHGKLIVLYVIRMARSLPLDSEVPGQVERGEAVLQQAEQISRLPRSDVEAELLQAREVGPAVVHEAAVRDVDAIVIGTGYPLEVGGFSLGKDIPYVLEYAACAVILVREPVGPARAERRELVGRAATRTG